MLLRGDRFTVEQYANTWHNLTRQKSSDLKTMLMHIIYYVHIQNVVTIIKCDKTVTHTNLQCQHCWGCILLWLLSLFHWGPSAWAKWSSTEAGVIMTSLWAGEGAPSDELWFLSWALVATGGLIDPLMLVLFRTVVMFAGFRVVIVTAGEVGIKSEWVA